MNPELTIIAIPFLCGAAFGAIAAILISRPHIRETIKRHEKETWKEAMRFYAAKQQEGI